MATINQVINVIKSADKCGRVVLMEAKHGVGKSQSVINYAKENDMLCEILMLSAMDTGDLLGIPETKTIGGITSTVWASPSWYTHIVNAAWPEVLYSEAIQVEDKELRDYLTEQGIFHNKEVTRGDLNLAYSTYKRLSPSRLQLLRQTDVTYKYSQRSVLFLDEFNRAPTDILNASLQLILDHRIHEHILPLVNGQETLLVAAINPADGDYTVQEFDAALLDRFIFVEVTPDLEGFVQWASKNNIHPAVTEFLMDGGSKYFHSTPKDGSKGTSPRSWEFVSDYLNNLQDENDATTHIYLSGVLGHAVASTFISFYQNMETHVTYDVLVKRLKKEVKDKGKDFNAIESSALFTTTLSSMEVVKRNDYSDKMYKEYFNKKGEHIFMLYLASLPLESLSYMVQSYLSPVSALLDKNKSQQNNNLFGEFDIKYNYEICRRVKGE